EAAGCDDNAPRTELELFALRLLHGPHADDLTVLDDERENADAVADILTELLGNGGVIGDEAFSTADVADVQATPEKVRAVLTLVGLALVHQTVFEAQTR